MRTKRTLGAAVDPATKDRVAQYAADLSERSKVRMTSSALVSFILERVTFEQIAEWWVEAAARVAGGNHVAPGGVGDRDGVPAAEQAEEVGG